MRILVVTPWFPTAEAPEQGVFVARDAAALAEAHDVRVLHLDWTGDAERRSVDVPGVEVRRLPLRRTRPLDFLRARRAVAHASADADVVHTHALPGLLPWLGSRVTSRPWVHTEHWSALTFPDTVSPAVRAMARLLSRQLKRPDVVVTVCTPLADAVRRHRRGPIEIVPCVVLPVEVAPRPDARFSLVGVGALVPRKDPLVAVATVAELRRRGHPATLTWVGAGPLADAVTGLAAELGVQDDVQLTGPVPPAEVAEHLQRSALLLLPTRGDNFCTVVAEALNSGRPAVSGAATGATDYAAPEVSRFVATQDPSAYADAVDSLVADTAELSAADVAATVAGRFTPEAVRRGLEAAYATAIRARGDRA